MNRVVAHFLDGHLVKGFTNDFLPARDHFHVAGEGDPPGTKPTEVKLADLKALFFVKTFAGDSSRQDVNDPSGGKAAPGRPIRVVFRDGEELVGTTQGYDRSRPGFFVVPIDPGSNNERCFVIAKAALDVRFL